MADVQRPWEQSRTMDYAAWNHSDVLTEFANKIDVIDAGQNTYTSSGRTVTLTWTKILDIVTWAARITIGASDINPIIIQTPVGTTAGTGTFQAVWRRTVGDASAVPLSIAGTGNPVIFPHPGLTAGIIQAWGQYQDA